MSTVPPVDTPVHLHDATGASHHCRVEDSGDTSVLVVPNGDSAARPPSVGDPMVLSWATLRGTFDLPVVFAAAESGARAQWMVRPTGEAKITQRRRYARVTVDVPLYMSTEDAAGHETVRGGWLIDISEGGARCTFPMGQIFEGARVWLRMELDGELEVTGHVLRVTAREGKDYVVVVFDAPPALADRLRAFVFAKQLAERRKQNQ